jgi:hypothetical protein
MSNHKINRKGAVNVLPARCCPHNSDHMHTQDDKHSLTELEAVFVEADALRRRYASLFKVTRWSTRGSLTPNVMSCDTRTPSMEVTVRWIGEDDAAFVSTCVALLSSPKIAPKNPSIPGLLPSTLLPTSTWR